jgi:hypothetical protein
MVAYTARKNPLAMATGAPAPAPAYDVSADAYQPGAMSAAPKMQAPMAASTVSPFSPPQGPPSNALLASALDGFQRGFDPAGFEKRQATNKAAEGDKLKQTLALMQQQRALPEEQRIKWAMDNADTVLKITGVNPRSMQLSPEMFANSALDGQIAALNAQMGIGPVVPEAYTLASGAERRGANNEIVASNPIERAPRAPIIINGVAYDPETYQPVITGREDAYTLGPGQVRMRGNEQIASGPARTQSNGINLTFGEGGAVSGLSIGGPSMGLGGTGTKGNEPAVVRSPQDGGPVVTPGEQQLRANKDWQRIKSGEGQSTIVLSSIARAKQLVGPWTTGPGASLKDLPVIGQSTDAGSLDNLLKTIKTNLGFDKLDEMRANSPTGAALGNVTEKELAFLQAVRGSMEQAQKPSDLLVVLDQVEDFVEQREANRKEAFAQDYPDLAEFAGFAKRTSDEVKRLSKDINKAAAEYNALPSGARYIDDDGNERTKK